MPQDPRLGNFVEQHLLAIHKQEPVVLLTAFAAAEDKIEFKQDPFPQVQVLYKKRWPILDHYRALKRAYSFLKDKGYKFELGHLHVCYPSGMVFLGFLKKLPFVITEHYSGYQSSRRHEWSKWAQTIALRIFNRASYVAPVSIALGHSLQVFGVKSPMQAVGNVVNTEVFKFTPAPEAKPFKLLHISSLQEKTKNIQGLLRGFKMALEKDPQLFLSIGGDGSLKELRDKIERAQLPEGSYEILAAMSPEEVAEKMAASHAFLLFSFIENQPVVLLESLCAGRPFISSKVGGISEFSDESNAILVEPRNEKALSEAILQMKGQYDSYDLVEISHKAHAEHGQEAIADKFSKLYSSARP